MNFIFVWESPLAIHVRTELIELISFRRHLFIRNTCSSEMSINVVHTIVKSNFRIQMFCECISDAVAVGRDDSAT